MILGLIAGVFYREYTKFIGFTGTSSLSVLHTHILILGMIFFLIVALFDKPYKISSHKKFNRFYIIYNLGLLTTVVMLVVRGLAEANSMVLSKGMDAAISGMAGLGHIILAVGLFTFYSILRAKANEK